MLDLNPSVTYTLKSHRKVIRIPPESEQLAELLGIIYGDGGINSPWQVAITMNSNADLLYSTYVTNLLKSLFTIDVASRKRVGKNALVLVCSGRNLVDFCVSKGAVRGNKIRQQIDIPDWIDRSACYQKKFVRGLVDTDGCLYIHKHVTKGSSRVQHNIGFCFTSLSKKLIDSVARILRDNGIEPHITKNYKNVYLYSAKAVQRYLEVFGSSNPRISNKYEEWLKTRRGG